MRKRTFGTRLVAYLKVCLRVEVLVFAAFAATFLGGVEALLFAWVGVFVFVSGLEVLFRTRIF